MSNLPYSMVKIMPNNCIMVFFCAGDEPRFRLDNVQFSGTLPRDDYL